MHFVLFSVVSSGLVSKLVHPMLQASSEVSKDIHSLSNDRIFQLEDNESTAVLKQAANTLEPILKLNSRLLKGMKNKILETEKLLLHVKFEHISKSHLIIIENEQGDELRRVILANGIPDVCHHSQSDFQNSFSGIYDLEFPESLGPTALTKLVVTKISSQRDEKKEKMPLTPSQKLLVYIVCQILTSYVTFYQTFADFFRDLEKKSNCTLLETIITARGNLSMDHKQLIATPVQRVPRYKIFLERLLKTTEPSRPDYANLSQSLAMVRKVAGDIDDNIRKQQVNATLLATQMKFEGNVELVAPSRIQIRQGEVSVTAAETLFELGPAANYEESQNSPRPILEASDKKVDSHLFLFKDLLIQDIIVDAEVFLDKRWMHNSFNSATPKENKITDSANQVQENKQRSKSLNREISQEKLLERDWGKQDESKKAPQNSKKEGSKYGELSSYFVVVRHTEETLLIGTKSCQEKCEWVKDILKCIYNRRITIDGARARARGHRQSRSQSTHHVRPWQEDSSSEYCILCD